MRTVALPVLTLALLLAAAAAQPDKAPEKDADKADKPGLKPGEDEIGGPFHAYAVTGKEKHRGTFHSPVSEYGLNPVILVFVRGTDPGQPVLDLLQKLDAVVAKNERRRLAGCVVFLSDEIGEPANLVKDNIKRDKEAAQVLDKAGKLSHLDALLDVPADVKDGYKLDDKAEVTVILYNKFRVLTDRAFAPMTLDEAGVQSVLDDINAKLDTLPGAPARKPAEAKK